MLFLTIIFGRDVNGKPYLSIGAISFYIVEISPLLFCLALAGILNKWDWNKPKKLFMGLLLCALPLVLIFACPSFSAGVIYSTTCITLMVVSGAGRRNSILLAGLMSGIIMLPFINAPQKLKGSLAFINPVIGSSGLFGKGLSLKPQFMPGLHTDFIFSYITFTFGWIAGGVLAALVVMFIIRMTRIAAVAKNNYAKLLTSGFVAIFAVQFLWNILMNLGFAPISGVGLPFISYGGSQLIFNAAALGVILSIYRRRNISKILINI